MAFFLHGYPSFSKKGLWDTLLPLLLFLSSPSSRNLRIIFTAKQNPRTPEPSISGPSRARFAPTPVALNPGTQRAILENPWELNVKSSTF